MVVGDVVYFGRYEQSGSILDGEEEIEWIVLETRSDRVLVISRYILERIVYDSADTMRRPGMTALFVYGLMVPFTKRYLSHTDTPFEIDESTVRKKLKEYTEMGILRDEKHGRFLYFRLAEDNVDTSAWEDAAAFFSEEAPFGVVGSYLLDRQSEAPEHFSYKHHYLLHTLDTQILFDALCAMKGKRCVSPPSVG